LSSGKPRVYLHDVLAKTETTSTQEYLARRRFDIREGGYDYLIPGSCGDRTAHHILLSQMPKDHEFKRVTGTIPLMLVHVVSSKANSKIGLSGEGLGKCECGERASSELLACVGLLDTRSDLEIWAVFHRTGWLGRVAPMGREFAAGHADIGTWLDILVEGITDRNEARLVTRVCYVGTNTRSLRITFFLQNSFRTGHIKLDPVLCISR
jgi:hypothetical protein